MSEAVANTQQNTPSLDDLNAQLAADEAARIEPEVEETVQAAPEEPVEQETEVEPEAKEDDEFEKRISRLAFEKRTAEKEARQLRERIARLEGKAPGVPQDEDENARVERRAAEIAAMQVYNDRANAIYRDGVAAYPDFADKLNGLREIGGIPQHLVEAADEIGDAHKIIHYLSKNLDEAERIVGLSPHRLGAALGKIATKLAAPPPKPVSKAPAPIKPLAGQGRAELTDEQMPIEEFMRREDERMANRRGRY